MFNFCIFVFISYFIVKVFRMVFPKKTVIHKGITVAQYAGERQRKTKKAPQKSFEMPNKNYQNKNYNNINGRKNSENCA